MDRWRRVQSNYESDQTNSDEEGEHQTDSDEEDEHQSDSDVEENEFQKVSHEEGDEHQTDSSEEEHELQTDSDEKEHEHQTDTDEEEHEYQTDSDEEEHEYQTDSDEEEHEYQTDTDEEEDDEYLYRVCAEEEDPNRGLTARDPTATNVRAKNHVGGKRDSPFVSTSKTEEATRLYLKLIRSKGKTPGKVVRINRQRLERRENVEIIDLTDPDVLEQEIQPTAITQRRNINKYQEILIRGRIPPSCIEILDPEAFVPVLDADFIAEIEGGMKRIKINKKDAEWQDESESENSSTEENEYESCKPRRYFSDESDDDYGQGGGCTSRTTNKKSHRYKQDGGRTTKKSEARATGRNAHDKASKRLLALTAAFQDALKIFIFKRKRTIQLLHEIVKLLNSCRKAGNITKISGASVGIVGAVATVASIPLTGGLSAFALVAGGILSVSGGITGVGGDVYVISREKELMEETRKILKDDNAEAKKLQKSAQALQSHVEHMLQMGKSLEFTLNKMGVSTFSLAGKVTSALWASQGFATIGKLSKVGKLAKSTSIVLSVVFVPLDIIQIFSSSSELQKDNSEKASMVQSCIDNLETDLAEKKELLTL